VLPALPPHLRRSEPSGSTPENNTAQSEAFTATRGQILAGTGIACTIMSALAAITPSLFFVHLAQGALFATVIRAALKLAGSPPRSSAAVATAVGFTFPAWFLAWAFPVAFLTGFAAPCNAHPDTLGGFLIAFPPAALGCASLIPLTRSAGVAGLMLIASALLALVGADMAPKAVDGNQSCWLTLSLLPSAWQMLSAWCVTTWAMKTPRSGMCVACGYDLTGLTSDRCPECGQPIAAPLLSPQRGARM
jgi:hypothetical protein